MKLAALVLVLLLPSLVQAAPINEAPPRCLPSQPCWPSPAEWHKLAASLTGKLVQPQSPLAECRHDATSQACTRRLRELRNPWFIQDDVAGTESAGWLDAWTAAPSAFAVVAENANDVVAAVDFARAHNIRLVVKGTGHDYLGRSSAPDSLLIWTHDMRELETHDSFVARGCAGPGVPALSVGAGTRWLEAYQETTGKHGRYVQGGGCTSVGAAGGFLQGGGFGSWSKQYGVAAASLIEAEVVTADGKLRVANACQNQDLFWALRGGGGGTFGIVTRATLMTHPLPDYFGWVNGDVKAKSDAAYKRLIARFLAFYRDALGNEHWGESVDFRRDNVFHVSMAFSGLTKEKAQSLWEPLRQFVAAHPEDYAGQLHFDAVPGARMWSFAVLEKYAPDAINVDDRAGAPQGRFWWRGDGDQVSIFWYAYQSRWLPIAAFAPESIGKLADAIFEGTRHWTLLFHFNKGLAGASKEAMQRSRATAMNPALFDAAALIIAASGNEGLAGVKGHEPDLAEAKEERDRISAAMRPIRDLTPNSGSYVNETDYFEPDWQRSFWGDNYEKLLSIKRKYDPGNLFFCHHCVGSESVTKH